MTTLIMRMIKGDFVVTGPRRRADEIQDAQGGEGVVHGSPSGIANQKGWPQRQAQTTSARRDG
jgi:hypothetical protein